MDMGMGDRFLRYEWSGARSLSAAVACSRHFCGLTRLTFYDTRHRYPREYNTSTSSCCSLCYVIISVPLGKTNMMGVMGIVEMRGRLLWDVGCEMAMILVVIGYLECARTGINECRK
jgi:hypothetical protein